MKEFLEKTAKVLEVDSVSPELDFRTVEDWCSLKAFGLLVMLENDYAKSVPVEEFLQLRTVADLARVAGVA